MENLINKVSSYGNYFWIKSERYNDTKDFNYTEENGIYTITYDGHLIHKTDGPAIERANGDREWVQNGRYHREDGPAFEYSDGDKFWYWQGKKFKTKQQWLAHKLKLIRDGNNSKKI